MKILTKGLVSIAVLSAAFAVGCGSGSGSADGSDVPGAGGAGGTAFGISMGDNCFEVVSIASGSSDGCMLGVADTVANMGPVGSSLPVNYDPNTGILKVGTDGSLGAGSVAFNVGTLTRDNTPALTSMPTCTFHQTDTSTVTVTATNTFDISVTETQDTFAAACSGTNVPTGGMCMSTWTWHLTKSTTQTFPNC